MLWDQQTRRIVSSSDDDLLRILGHEFDAFASHPELDLYPSEHRVDIDVLSARIYETVNDGVYRAGFATSQTAYEKAVHPLFETLDFLEARLGSRCYLFGSQPLETDWRLFVTLVRFDAAYFGHFKCNLRVLRITLTCSAISVTSTRFQVSRGRSTSITSSVTTTTRTTTSTPRASCRSVRSRTLPLHTDGKLSRRIDPPVVASGQVPRHDFFSRAAVGPSPPTRDGRRCAASPGEWWPPAATCPSQRLKRSCTLASIANNS